MLQRSGKPIVATADSAQPVQSQPAAKPEVGSLSLDSILKGVGAAREESPKAVPAPVAVRPEQTAVAKAQEGDAGASSLFEGDIVTPEGADDIFPTAQEAQPAAAQAAIATVQPQVGTDDPFAAVFSQQGSPQPTKLQVSQEQSQLTIPSAPPTGSFMTVPFGTEVSRFPINRFKAVTGVQYRGAIPAPDALSIVKIHFNQEVGYFYCFGGVCCENEGLPAIRYVLPWILYETDKSAKPVSTNFDMMYLQLGEDAYKILKALHAQVNIGEIDFLVTCADEHYQENSFQNIGPALWKHPKSPIKEAVVAKFKEVWKFVPKVVARTFTEEMYLKAILNSTRGPSQVHMPASPSVSSLSTFLRQPGK